MASAVQLTLTGTTTGNEKLRRNSYSREFKRSIVSLHRQNNLYQTSKKFDLNTKTILRRAATEEAISMSSKGSKLALCQTPETRTPRGRSRSHAEFKEMRQKGLKVKRYCFKLGAWWGFRSGQASVQCPADSICGWRTKSEAIADLQGYRCQDPST